MDRILLTSTALAAAYFLDILIGDPRFLPHPVRLLGMIIVFLEKRVRRLFRSPASLKIAGLLILIITAGGSVAVTIVLLGQAYRVHIMLGLLLETYILFTVLAGGDLRNHVYKVEQNLGFGKLGRARSSAALLVSRDTAGLDESGVSRATLESLFENSADGLVAPLFFAAAGGPAAAVCFKAVNTLDSMIGYKNDEYGDLGFFPAKTDDILSFIPARLTALLIILAGGRMWRDGLRTLIRDHRKHDSPNSAWPEAAAAGVLGLSFGGADSYNGEAVLRPVINAGGREPEGGDIKWGLALFRRTSILAFVSLIMLYYFLRTWEALPF